MYRTPDSAVLDERRHQAQLERSDRLSTMADELAATVMEKGARYDPFKWEWLDEAMSESPTIGERIGELLRQGDFCLAGQMLADLSKSYVKPLAYEWALDRVER